MLTFDSEDFVFAPIRKVYIFHLTLTAKFFAETICGTAAEREFLESRIPIGKPWSAVSVIMEDWRSHLVLKIKEGDPYSISDVEEGKTPAEHGGSAWAWERRTRAESIYAHDFNRYSEVELWRRYLSESQKEYITLDVVHSWTLRFSAVGGRLEWTPKLRQPVNPRKSSKGGTGQ